AGIAVMLEILTDNRNRTAAEIRKLFERHGGNLGTTGAVAWMFDRKATFPVARSSEFDEDRLLEIALEAGAEDLTTTEGGFEIRCDAGSFAAVREALVAAGVPFSGEEVGYVPSTVVEIDRVEDARRVVRCLDALEEHDDVQSVYANASFSDEVLARLAEEDA